MVIVLLQIVRVGQYLVALSTIQNLITFEQQSIIGYYFQTNQVAFKGLVAATIKLMHQINLLRMCSMWYLQIVITTSVKVVLLFISVLRIGLSRLHQRSILQQLLYQPMMVRMYFFLVKRNHFAAHLTYLSSNRVMSLTYYHLKIQRLMFAMVILLAAYKVQEHTN